MPVVGKDADEILARAETFRVLAEIQLQQPDIQAANVAFDPASALVLAEAYFALSEAYKRKRLKETSRTEWSKAAALVAATVSVINPIRPAGRCDNPAWPYLNPAFGILCAFGHAQQIFFPATFDARRRLLQSLQSLRLPCLDAIIAEANKQGQLTTTWSLVITEAEMSILDALVSQVELLRQNQDILAELERLKAEQEKLKGRR